MTPERWETIKQTVRKQFKLEEEGTEDLIIETGEGALKQGEAEFVIFESPMGRLKLELQKKPRLEEKKFHYSHQQGKAARVEYKFSENETVLTFKAYRWDDRAEEWKEIDADAFGGISN
jgi:hypothetical protein